MVSDATCGGQQHEHTDVSCERAAQPSPRPHGPPSSIRWCPCHSTRRTAALLASAAAAPPPCGTARRRRVCSPGRTTAGRSSKCSTPCSSRGTPSDEYTKRVACSMAKRDERDGCSEPTRGAPAMGPRGGSRCHLPQHLDVDTANAASKTTDVMGLDFSCKILKVRLNCNAIQLSEIDMRVMQRIVYGVATHPRRPHHDEAHGERRTAACCTPPCAAAARTSPPCRPTRDCASGCACHRRSCPSTRPSSSTR